MRNTPSRATRILAASALTFLASARALDAQQPVPVRELSPPEAKTSEVFGNIFSVRPLTDGRVLVNDGVRRQLVALDQNFGKRTLLVDSMSTGGQSYGPRAAPLIPYLADSSLFVDVPSLSLLVIDPTGKIARVMSAPKANDLRFLNGSQSGTDNAGNLIYRAAMVMNAPKQMPQPGQPMAPIQPPDSAPIVRANFESRTVDTLGRVKVQSGTRARMTQDGNGKTEMKVTVNPLITVDEWAVLSDGTVALVRGHDYHVDMIKPDGKTFSTGKLPFDWKRLTDEDKQALIDSAKTAQEKQAADAKAAGANNPMAALDRMAAVAGMAGGGGGGGGGGMIVEIHRSDAGGGGGRGDIAIGGPPGGPGAFQMPTPVFDFVPLKEIADYYPAIRSGAAKADLDGNLWLLPTTSAQSKAGELVYDVVNNRGELFQRVRLPVGRSIAGFGHNGIVFLMYREGLLGWHLERTKILTGARAER